MFRDRKADYSKDALLTLKFPIGEVIVCLSFMELTRPADNMGLVCGTTSKSRQSMAMSASQHSHPV
jgi:hypothetical protein